MLDMWGLRCLEDRSKCSKATRTDFMLMSGAGGERARLHLVIWEHRECDTAHKMQLKPDEWMRGTSKIIF